MPDGHLNSASVDHAVSPACVSSVVRPQRTIMKTNISLLLIALLVSSNGCMTYSAVQEANGRHDKAVRMGQSSYGHDDKSHPGYYFLMPLTIPGDVAFSPFEAVWWSRRRMERESGG